MLYKNGEKVDFSTDYYRAELSKIRKQFKFPIILRYPQEKVRYSALNKRIEYPQGALIPMIDNAPDNSKEGQGIMCQWLFSSTNPVGRDNGRGGMTYMPEADYFNFKNNTHLLTEKDIELVYFLWTKCSRVIGGENAKPNSACLLRFENLEKEAEDFVLSQEMEAEMKALLFNRTTRISFEDLKKVSKAIFIPGVDGIDNENYLRKAVADALKLNDNLTRDFIAVASDLNTGDDRAIIQEAFDFGVLSYYGPKDYIQYEPTAPNFPGKKLFKPASKSNLTAQTYEYLKSAEAKDAFEDIKRRVAARKEKQTA